MKNNLYFRLLAIVIVAMLAVQTYAQVSFQVVQGETKTYTANINSTGHPAAGITFSWSLTAGTNPFTDSGAATQSVTWSGAVGTGYQITVTPSYGGCPFSSQAKTANIEILPTTLDIAWTAAIYTSCSNTAIVVAVQSSGFNFTTGNTYDIELSVDGAAAAAYPVTYTNGTTNGTISVTIANTTAADTTPSLEISNIRINGGAWQAKSHSRTVTVTPEPVLDNITSN